MPGGVGELFRMSVVGDVHVGFSEDVSDSARNTVRGHADVEHVRVDVMGCLLLELP